MATTTATLSRVSSRTGRQEPTKLVVPDFAGTEVDDCHAICAAGGLHLLEWQDAVLEGWLGTDRFGRWTAPTCAGSIPRQNGKTLGLVVPRAIYGMVMLGEEVIYTSHLQKTSTETFESIASFFDQKALRKYVKDIKTALGREAVVLNNGARVKFLARTRNGGRGQHGDLLVFDEALELDADSQASFLPAISASRNPQTIYVSTPPTAKSDGSVFRGIRDRALKGETDRTAWFEWGVDEIGDVTDRERWYATNPSMGLLIDEETVAGECEQMDADTFARERLGWWSSTVNVVEPALAWADWEACRTDEPTEDGLAVYAVKFSPDGAVGTLAKCTRPDGGTPFVYVVDSRSMSGGLSWFVDNLAERWTKAAQIVIDGQGNAQALNDRLRDAGVPAKVIVRPRTGDVIAACSRFADAVVERSVAHWGQPALDAAASCPKRKIGTSGGWGFASTEAADATLMESVALAYWGAMTTKRKPGRKAVIF